MNATAGRDHPSGRTARTVAQAKVNLFLRVLAREADGYHQIETLFCRLELGDDVAVRVGVGGRSLDCAGDALPTEGLGPVERNLAWRAAVMYADATGWPNDWSIEIAKRIPVGGGLGGGSSDAGAVLRCLNQLAPSPLSDDELLALAAPLGADVPFLTTRSPSVGGAVRGCSHSRLCQAALSRSCASRSACQRLTRTGGSTRTRPSHVAPRAWISSRSRRG